MIKCLIVEDNTLIREVGRVVLENMGCTVLEACDGVSGLDICLLSKPDVVFLDWRMPIMDGFGFLHALKTQVGIRRPKIIFCTTRAELDHILEAVQRGADSYLVKPFHEELFRRKLGEVGLLRQEAPQRREGLGS